MEIVGFENSHRFANESIASGTEKSTKIRDYYLHTHRVARYNHRSPYEFKKIINDEVMDRTRKILDIIGSDILKAGSMKRRRVSELPQGIQSSSLEHNSNCTGSGSQVPGIVMYPYNGPQQSIASALNHISKSPPTDMVDGTKKQVSWSSTEQFLQPNGEQTSSASPDSKVSEQEDSCITCEDITGILVNLDIAGEQKGPPGELGNLEHAHNTLSNLRLWIRQHGAPFLDNFFDAGGILRLLLYLKRSIDDPVSVDHATKILSHCLYASRAIKEKTRKCIAPNQSKSTQGSIDLQRISNDTARLILKHFGTESFLKASDRYVTMLKATMVDPNQDLQQQTTIVQALNGIWRILRLLCDNPTTAKGISGAVLFSVFHSALGSMETVGTAIDSITGETMGDKSKLEGPAAHVMIHAFETLQRVVKFSNIEKEQSFYTLQKGILKNCIDILQANGRSGRLRCTTRRKAKVVIAAESFFVGFFEKFQMGKSPELFKWFSFERLLTNFIGFIKESPGERNNGMMIQLLWCISSSSLVSKTCLLKEHGIASALSAVMESEEATPESKKLAQVLLVSTLG